MDIKDYIQQQRDFFLAQSTKDISYRIKVLKDIKQWIIDNEEFISDALKKDLNKDPVESYMCEIGLLLSEISYQVKHIRKWSKRKKVWTPMSQFYSLSYETYEPYGVTLVMSPWNYPFLLAIEPAIGAIAAGNCVVIKPSEYAPHVSSIIQKMISEVCDERHVLVVEGGLDVNTELLNERFDYIFFTGSVPVGKIIMEKASHYLTPVTLELGGKSPCIVDDEHKLKLSAKRIAFGKFLNAGQTCVAPDYLFIKEDLKDKFIEYMKEIINEFFTENPILDKQLVKIINEKQYHRLINLMKDQDIVLGGECNEQTLKIAPTIIDTHNQDSLLMQEEIFGPILPIRTYQTIDEAIAYINQKESPLALYLFSSHKDIQDKVLQCCRFGGGCINDTIIHLATSELGFGGVGYSGMGSYHGKKSFDTFSHTKSIVKKAKWIDLPLRYYPYNSFKEKMIRFFMK
ncbi:MAG: aldehyde dehydrogenase [Coprobacillus sp.]